MVKKIYIYLVSFVTLIMSIGGGVNIFVNVADLIAPSHYIQTFEEFKMSRHSYPCPMISRDASVGIEPSNEIKMAPATDSVTEPAIDPSTDKTMIYPVPPYNPDCDQKAEEELRQEYNEYKKEIDEREKRLALNNIIQSLGWIIIPLPIFVYLQRKMKDNEK